MSVTVVPIVRYRQRRSYRRLPPDARAKPLLPLRLHFAGKTTPELTALVDSGADLIVPHTDVADYLGIDLSTRESY